MYYRGEARKKELPVKRDEPLTPRDAKIQSKVLRPPHSSKPKDSEQLRRHCVIAPPYYLITKAPRQGIEIYLFAKG